MSFKLGYKSFIGEPYHIYDANVTIKDTHIRPDINVGRYTSIGQNLCLVFNQHDYKHTSTHPIFSDVFCRGHIKIGNDVWIGINVTIMDGVTIGDGAVVGAGAIVTKDVPPYAIVTGNPAKILKYRFSPELIDKFIKASWWNYDEHQLISMGIRTKSPDEFLDSILAKSVASNY